MTLTVGIDVGTSGVKVAVMEVNNALLYGNNVESKTIALRSDRIRRRLPDAVVEELLEMTLAEAGINQNDVDYIASTGDGEVVTMRRGHFYGMTTHARGGLFLSPDANAVLDIGALHARAMTIDQEAKVVAYRMTSQCASGSGQFLENIARYLGITLEDVGPMSLESDNPEMVSGICAVLAETDVINMVSRGISTPDIIKGIHISMANRLAKLLGVIRASGKLILTGGLAEDVGLTKTINEELIKLGNPLVVTNHKDSVYAGAIGAALWGAYRHEKLAQRKVSAA